MFHLNHSVFKSENVLEFRFTADQNDEFVFLRISVPYVKVSSSEVVVDDR